MQLTQRACSLCLWLLLPINVGPICLLLGQSCSKGSYIRESSAGFLNNQLSSTMLVGIEVAVEYWLALSHSPQAQWLRYSDPSGCLLVRLRLAQRCVPWSCCSLHTHSLE